MSKLTPALITCFLLTGSLTFACFNPADRFAFEVLLNKPGAKYDLTAFGQAKNVTITNGNVLYLSHFDKLVAVILSEVSADDFLKGLSVRLQIPTKVGIRKRFTVDTKFDGQIKADFDAGIIKSLGFKVQIERDADQNISITLKKQDLYVYLYETSEGLNVGFYMTLDSDSINDNVIKDLKAVFNTLGINPDLIDTILKSATIEESEDLMEAVKVDKDDFDFSSAIKEELNWLIENVIVIGINEADVLSIASFAEAGLAGWNSRIVHAENGWIPYYNTPEPNLIRFVDCGPFSLDRLPYEEPAIINKPNTVRQSESIPTKWGAIKSKL